MLFNRNKKSHKSIYIIAAAVICLTMTGPSVLTGEVKASPFDGQELSYGMFGPQVSELQKTLSELGYLYNYPQGIYGDTTYYAVQAFQSDYGLEVTGEADWQTLEMLYGGYGYDAYEPGAFDNEEGDDPDDWSSSDDNWSGSDDNSSGSSDNWSSSNNDWSGSGDDWNNPNDDWSDPYDDWSGQYEEETLSDTGSDYAAGTYDTLSYGDYGDDVWDMQYDLYMLGYLDSWPDGDFGWYSWMAVKEFQMFNGLDVTGTADPETLEMLYSGYAQEFYALEYGMSGTAVYGLQQQLIQLGYLNGAPDGIFDDPTYDAVVQFQTQNDVYPTSGIAGRLTCDALMWDPIPAPELAETAWENDNDPDHDDDSPAAGAEDAYTESSNIVYGGTYIIGTSLGSEVLDVAGASTWDGANVQLYDLNYSGTQKWVLQTAGDGYYRLRNLRSWKCLDIAGDNVLQSEYDPSSWTQLWYFAQDEYGYYYIINANGMYLGVYTGYSAAGVNVDAWWPGESAGQTWAMYYVDSNTALDFEEDGTQYIGLRSFEVNQGNVTETSYYYNIETSIYLPDGGYYLSGGDNYSIGLKVMYVNCFLAEAGYLSWDYYNYNRYDGNTVWAVMAFQEDVGLEADGVVGINTWLAMGYSEWDFYHLGSYTTPLKVYAYGSSREDYINAMLATAEEYAAAGTQYSDGASGEPGTYVDCSGLIFQCLYAAGINPDTNIIDHARVVYEYTSWYLGNDWRMGEAVWDAQPGDLIFYGSGSINHIAIYAGGGMIYDSWPGLGVTYRSMYAPGNILKIVRVF